MIEGVNKLKINYNNQKLLKILDDYGLLTVLLLFTIKFYISSIRWIYSDPFLNLHDILGYLSSLFAFPLFPIIILVWIRKKYSSDKEIMNFVKFFEVFYNFPMFLIFLIMIFNPFKFESYFIITIFMLSIIMFFFWMCYKFWRDKISKISRILGPILVGFYYIVNVFRPLTTEPSFLIFLLIMIIYDLTVGTIIVIDIILRIIKKRKTRLETEIT